MIVCTAPDPLEIQAPSIFLAGSIEQDRAEQWQQIVIERLDPYFGTILNPRREQWNADWEQSIDHPEFRQQVEWELEALERADLIILYFDPNTKAPISLLELGLFARSGKILLCCPEGYWRKGNVDIVCRRYGIEQFETLDGLIKATIRQFSMIDPLI